MWITKGAALIRWRRLFEARRLFRRSTITFSCVTVVFFQKFWDISEEEEEQIWEALHDSVPFAQFKNVKNTHGGVILLAKLQAKA